MSDAVKEKPVIYQLLVRLAGNTKVPHTLFGSLEENGCGTFNDLSLHFLKEIKKLGCTHIWLTGLIRHATCSRFTEHGIPASNPLFVKGVAGSPYAISDYYDVSADLSTSVPERMQECEALIDRCQQAGLPPIMDFVPNHVAREYHSINKPKGVRDLGEDDDTNTAFAADNNFYYLPDQSLQLPEDIYQLPYVGQGKAGKPLEHPARVTGNDCFSPNPSINDWYETIKLNYGLDYANNKTAYFTPVPDTWKKMLDILRFWAAKGISGFRCDMAEMVPLAFWAWCTHHIKEEFPDLIFIAEAYDPSSYASLLGEGGFDYLYDKVGLYDTLKAVLQGRQAASAISDVWQQLNGLDPYMLRFMENHDEERIASKAFGVSPWAGLAAMTVSALLHQGPLMIYFGQELGEKAEGNSGYSGDDGKTSIFDYWHVPAFQQWFNHGQCRTEKIDANSQEIRAAYSQLLSLCRHEVFCQGAFYDLMWANKDNDTFDAGKLYAFLRWKDETVFLIVVNFHTEHALRTILHIPHHFWEHAGMDVRTSFSLGTLLGSHGNIDNHKPSDASREGLAISIGPLSSMIIEVS